MLLYFKHFLAYYKIHSAWLTDKQYFVPLLKLAEIKKDWLKLTAKYNLVVSTRKSLIFPKINRKEKNTVLKPSVMDRQG